MSLIEVFNKITYTVNLGDGQLSFSVGDILDDSFYKLKNSIFITANNPNGIIVPNNKELNIKLLKDIKTNYLTGVGGGNGHIEYHYLILDTNLVEGHSLAIKFKQLAYIHITHSLQVCLHLGI